MRGTQHAIALAAGVVLGLAGQALMTRLRILYMSKMRRRRLPYFLSDRCAEAQRLRSGGRFEARHPDVWPMLRYAKEMCDEFNSQPLGARPREVILRDLFGSIPTVGPPPNVEAPIYVCAERARSCCQLSLQYICLIRPHPADPACVTARR